MYKLNAEQPWFQAMHPCFTSMVPMAERDHFYGVGGKDATDHRAEFPLLTLFMMWESVVSLHMLY